MIHILGDIVGLMAPAILGIVLTVAPISIGAGVKIGVFPLCPRSHLEGLLSYCEANHAGRSSILRKAGMCSLGLDRWRRVCWQDLAV